jgi:glycosyltransferase involved in cell wall biosynthesis
MEIAYLTTEYPAVSHTFIRREILALENIGHVIHRYSIQDCKNISDPVDELERDKTFYCLAQGKFKLLLSGLHCLLRAPLKSLKALGLTLDFNRKSERGIIKHIAYFLEATLLLREFNKKGIKHVHVHFGTNATTVALLVSMLGGPSYSFTVHGPDEFDAPRGLSLCKKITRSAFTIGISQYCCAQLKRWANLDSWSKIKIIHCTVSDDFLLPVPGITSGSNTIICVGRLSAQKGIFILIEAAKKLSEQGLDFKIILAGDGELRLPIEARIRESGLEDKISITGWVDGTRIKELLLSSRGLVLPSFAEGLPVVLMEALAMKRPVVTTCINGIPELVKDGENGFLTIPGDVESLANGIGKLLHTPVEQLNEMGGRGHDVVKSFFTAESQIPILAKYFEEALMNQGHR